MRNLLALFGAAVLGFGGAGWYLGWYTVKVSKGSDGTVQVQTSLDTNKVVTDAGNGIRQAGELLGKQADKAAKDAPNPANTPAPKAEGGWLLSQFADPPPAPALAPTPAPKR